jgi:hypothetical protein
MQIASSVLDAMSRWLVRRTFRSQSTVVLVLVPPGTKLQILHAWSAAVNRSHGVSGPPELLIAGFKLCLHFHV